MSADISGMVSPNGTFAAASPSALKRVMAMRMRPSRSSPIATRLSRCARSMFGEDTAERRSAGTSPSPASSVGYDWNAFAMCPRARSARDRVRGHEAHRAARVEDDGHGQRTESGTGELAASGHEPTPRKHAAELSGVHGNERAVARTVDGPVGIEVRALPELQREAMTRRVDAHDDELRAPSLARRGELGVAPLDAGARRVPAKRRTQRGLRARSSARERDPPATTRATRRSRAPRARRPRASSRGETARARAREPTRVSRSHLTHSPCHGLIPSAADRIPLAGAVEVLAEQRLDLGFACIDGVELVGRVAGRPSTATA